MRERKKERLLSLLHGVKERQSKRMIQKANERDRECKRANNKPYTQKESNFAKITCSQLVCIVRMAFLIRNIHTTHCI